MINLIKKLLKESEEDFGWAEELLDNDIDKPRQVYINNKRYCIESEDSSNGWSSDGFRTTNWTGWYDVIGLEKHRDRLCYVVDYGVTYPKVYMPMEDFKKEDIKF